MEKQEIIDNYYPDEEILIADGFDDAIIGMVYNGLSGHNLVAYSVTKRIKILMEQGMSHETAREYFDFNVSGAYVGSKTPIWVEDELFLE